MGEFKIINKRKFTRLAKACADLRNIDLRINHAN